MLSVTILLLAWWERKCRAADVSIVVSHTPHRRQWSCWGSRLRTDGQMRSYHATRSRTRASPVRLPDSAVNKRDSRACFLEGLPSQGDTIRAQRDRPPRAVALFLSGCESESGGRCQSTPRICYPSPVTVDDPPSHRNNSVP